jgi:hypothetical protein
VLITRVPLEMIAHCLPVLTRSGETSAGGFGGGGGAEPAPWGGYDTLLAPMEDSEAAQQLMSLAQAQVGSCWVVL